MPARTRSPVTADDDVEIEAADDTFLEEEEEDSDDVVDLIDGEIGRTTRNADVWLVKRGGEGYTAAARLPFAVRPDAIVQRRVAVQNSAARATSSRMRSSGS